VATGETHSVREFVEESFKELGIAIKWEGAGDKELGKNAATGDVVVAVDPKYYRPTEVDLLLGDPRKAERLLGWKPKIAFKELVKDMIRGDTELLEKGDLHS